MISKTVLAKGQVVIPKTIRDLLGINVGDELIIDVKDERIILSKKMNVLDIFQDVSEKSRNGTSMKEIKRELESRYGGE